MGNFNVYLLSFVVCLVTYVQSYAITGVQGGVNEATGQRPSRKEFSTFKTSGAPFDLYILALQQLQQEDQSTLISFYQIGGETSKPFRER